MIIAKGKAGEVAVEIENNVSIDVNEEITLALFGINEPLYL
jgi:hypothetical protein